MKIYNVSQATETEAWLEARRGKITGTKAKGLALEHYAYKDPAVLIERAVKSEEAATKARTPEKAQEYLTKAKEYRVQAANADIENQRLKVTQDFWKYLAEVCAEQADGENPLERGHRLEPVNIVHTLSRLGIAEGDAVSDTGLWVSDDNQNIACSPDAHEKGAKVTWAIECKSLSTANHIAAVLPHLVHERLLDGETNKELDNAALAVLPEFVGLKDVSDYEFIPDIYKAQALQYFVVNDDLQTLYFSFYDDRVFSENLRHHILTIHRSEVADKIETQKAAELKSLGIANALRSVLDIGF